MIQKKLNFSTASTMAILPAVAGFLNAYTFVRWSFMATPNTGNLTRIGTNLATASITGILEPLLPFLIPIFGTILGSFITTLMNHGKHRLPMASFQITVLLVEFLCFMGLGILPDGTPVYPVLLLAAVVGGMQLSSFRKWGELVHNTTIATGNMRSVGEYWGELCHKPSAAAAKKAISYTGMVLTWPLGAFLGTVLTIQQGIQSIWLCALGILVVLTQVVLKAEQVEA